MTKCVADQRFKSLSYDPRAVRMTVPNIPAPKYDFSKVPTVFSTVCGENASNCTLNIPSEI